MDFISAFLVTFDPLLSFTWPVCIHTFMHGRLTWTQRSINQSQIFKQQRCSFEGACSFKPASLVPLQSPPQPLGNNHTSREPKSHFLNGFKNQESSFVFPFLFVCLFKAAKLKPGVMQRPNAFQFTGISWRLLGIKIQFHLRAFCFGRILCALWTSVTQTGEILRQLSNWSHWIF